MTTFALLQFAHAISTLRVFLLSCWLLPPTSDASAATHWRLASAIVDASSNLLEQDVLATIARHESSYDSAVADCRRMGAAGDRGAWQVVPRSFAESLALCVSYEQDARIALDRVRESVLACRHLPANERLAVYARGRCDSAEGRRLSRQRWPAAR